MVSLYLDTAIRSDAEPLLELGIFRGLTTNPTILQRAGLSADDIPGLYRWAVGLGLEEVFFQTWGATPQDMVERGRRLRGLGDEVVVKVPANRIGTQAATVLAAEGIPTLLTAVHHAGQAVVAAASGARYLAPYLGKMGDAGHQAHQEVIVMQEVLNGLASPTRLLVASLRSPADVVTLARHGVSCFALPPAVAANFFVDPATNAAAEAFELTANGWA